MLYKIMNRTGLEMKFWPSSEEDRDNITSLFDDPQVLPVITSKGNQPEKSLLGGRGRMSYAAPTTNGRRMVISIVFADVSSPSYFILSFSYATTILRIFNGNLSNST
jgi:hypothetical protein